MYVHQYNKYKERIRLTRTYAKMHDGIKEWGNTRNIYKGQNYRLETARNRPSESSKEKSTEMDEGKIGI